MKLALSSRLWESIDGYNIDQLQHLEVAYELDYNGVEMRYPLLPRSKAHIKKVASVLRDRRLVPVFGPCAGVPNDQESWDDALRVMDTLYALGARWIKCIPMREEDVAGMVQLANMAREREMILCTQLHSHTLTDTVASTEKFLNEVDHPALGVIFDAAHLQISKDSEIYGAVERLRRWLQLVNIQCVALNEKNGEFASALPGEPGATDLKKTLGALQGIDKWLTVMPSCTTNQDPVVVAKLYRDALLKASCSM